MSVIVVYWFYAETRKTIYFNFPENFAAVFIALRVFQIYFFDFPSSYLLYDIENDKFFF